MQPLESLDSQINPAGEEESPHRQTEIQALVIQYKLLCTYDLFVCFLSYIIKNSQSLKCAMVIRLDVEREQKKLLQLYILLKNIFKA